MRIPLVTIVGRPNVGKSTLFNALAGRRIAITTDVAGTTRDRIFFKCEAKGIPFYLVDTAGLEFDAPESGLEENVQRQARLAIAEADVIVLMTDGQTGLMPQDEQAAALLRKEKGEKPLFLLANKCEFQLEKERLSELYRLGLGEPYAVSALHRQGTAALLEGIGKTLKTLGFKPEPKKQENPLLKIALVGRPNVGKSSLLNALLQKEIAIVSDVPGTTRDSLDVTVKSGDKEYLLTDTAGLRRKGKVERGIESLSALRTLAAVERCDVAMLLIDSAEGVIHQDQALAGEIIATGKGIILVISKWDKSANEETDETARIAFLRRLQHRFPFLAWAPAVFTSARERRNLKQLFALADTIGEERKKKIPTGTLNAFLKEVMHKHPPTGTKKTMPKLRYGTQTGIEPPTFRFFVNREDAFHFSWWRYLENRLREKFGFSGTPVAWEVTDREQSKKDH